MSSSDDSSSPVPGWMEFWRSDEEQEAAANITLLPSDGRAYVWWMAKILTEQGQGIAGQACHLLEKYIATLTSNMTRLVPDSAEWNRTKDRLRNKLPLLVIVCIQLAAKMCSAESLANTRTMRCNLIKSAVMIYSMNEITTAEQDVFKILGYRVPLWTNVEKGMMLAREVGITGVYLEAVGVTVDIAEYYRVAVQTEVHPLSYYTASTSNNPESPTVLESEPGPSTSTSNSSNRVTRTSNNIRMMHLVAGAVLTALQYTRYSGQDPIPKLAELTCAPPAYLCEIRDDIFHRLGRLLAASTIPSPPPPEPVSTWDI